MGISVSDDELMRALKVYEEHDRSVTAAAKAMNLARTTLVSRLDLARRRGLNLSEGARRAIKAAALGFTEAKGGWIVDVDKETGSRTSTYWRAPEEVISQTEVLDYIRERFEGMKPARGIAPPRTFAADLCTVYPLMDAHVGMHAWGMETHGPNYDLKLAIADMKAAFEKLIALSPRSAEAVLIVGGDFFHTDDNRNETPQSKNKLDTDGRLFKVLDSGIEVMSYVIDRLLATHGSLIVKVLRGNHDPHSHMVLTFALSERYRSGRVVVERSPTDIFMKQWGSSAIFAHHGDKIKPQQIALYLSAICPFWSSTDHKHLFTGHVHHDAAKDIGPLRWESLRAFAPPDAFAASMGYVGRRGLQAITFHKENGIILRAIDPVRSTDDGG